MHILVTPLLVLGVLSVLLLALGIRQVAARSVGGGTTLIVAGLVVAGAAAALFGAVSIHLGA